MHVFPACAGMFLIRISAGSRASGFPRVRGDVPFPCLVDGNDCMFSPRARGCSTAIIASFSHHIVFPACAGMFRWGVDHEGVAGGFPRVRGDVPADLIFSINPTKFSPRARGCSERDKRQAFEEEVFPACAGMFPLFMKLIFCRVCFPRVRGDVPLCWD